VKSIPRDIPKPILPSKLAQDVAEAFLSHGFCKQMVGKESLAVG
jgi:hypothetical protein